MRNILRQRELAEAEQDDVIDIIKTIGMYKTKSRNIISLAKVLCDKYGGEVPGTHDELIELPGVGKEDCQCSFVSRIRTAEDSRRYPCFPCYQPDGAGIGERCSENGTCSYEGAS